MPHIKKITLCAVFLFVFALPAQADTLNQEKTFFTNRQYEIQGAPQVTATLRLISERVYWYVGNTHWESLAPADKTRLSSFLTSIASEFDGRIYPIETSFFGSEPNPGIDNDTRLTIVITPLRSNIGGYFDSTSEYPLNETPGSNEREIIFLTTPDFADSKRLYTFLAHEFQHLITFNQKEKLRGVTEDIWLNELRSEYAVTLLGYNDPFNNSNLQRRSMTYIQNASDSLTEWKNLPADYAQIALFGEYIAEHTSPSVIGASARTNSAGVIAVSDALRQHGFSLSFTDLFSNWLVASILNNASAGSQYAYTRSGLDIVRIIPTYTINNPSEAIVYSTIFNIKDWEGNWIDITNISAGTKNELGISFSAPSLESFSVPYAILHADGRWTTHAFNPGTRSNMLNILSLGSDVKRIILMPFTHEKLFGFSAYEPDIRLSISLSRISEDIIPLPTLYQRPEPEQFGLHEGDFVRAEGDNDVYIVNQYGYKRLVLNPAICLMYGHLGDRGCFSAVKTVSPATRDAFETSWYVTNGEARDGEVYQIIPLGDDIARINDTEMKQWNLTLADPPSVFVINTNEQRIYVR